MLRAFLAIRIPPTPALATALEQLRAMGSALKPVTADNLHLTLRFLGVTDEALLPQIAAALREATTGVAPFDLDLSGAGAFPTPGRPSVIWVGGDAAGPLTEIVERLNPAIDALGFGREERPWNCHLTLARVKARPPAAWPAFHERYREAGFGRVRVASVELMLSELLPQGPKYSVAESIALRGG